MTRRFSFLTCASLACMLAPAVARAQDPEPATGDQDQSDLDGELGELLGQELVSGASKQSERVSDAPAVVFTMTAEDMERHGIRTLDEAINYLSNGMTAQRPYAEVGARGLLITGDGGNHFLVAVNGHYMNEPWGGWQRMDRGLGVPWEMVDHVELIMGPGSVLYGTNAMFGVINVVTKSPKNHEGVHVVAQGSTSPPLGKNQQIRTAGDGHRMGYFYRASAGMAKTFRVGDKDGGINFQLEFYDDQGPTMWFGPQDSPYDAGPDSISPSVWGGIASRRQWGGGGMVQTVLGNWTIDLMGNVHLLEDPFDDEADFGDGSHTLITPTARLDVKHRFDATTRIRLDSRFYADYSGYDGAWIYSDVDEWCPGVTARCSWEERSPAAWTGLEERVTFDWLHDQSLVTMVGADGRFRWVHDEITINEVDSGAPSDIDFLNYDDYSGAGAVYFSQSYWPIKRLGLNAGVRLDLDQYYGYRFSPRAAITGQPWKLGTIKLVYAEAFRAPGIGEIRFEDPTYSLKADDLQPESVRSLELMLEQRFAGGLGWVRVGGFYSWYSDLIGVGTISQAQFDDAVARGKILPDTDIEYVEQYQNLDDVRAYGGYLGLDANTKDRKWNFGLNFTVAQSQKSDGGDIIRPLAMYPTYMGNARVSYSPGGFIPTFGLIGSYNSRRRTQEDVDDEFDMPLRSSHTFQGRFTVVGEIPKTGGLHYTLGADYTLGRYSPYLAGPLKYSDVGFEDWRGERVPVNQLEVMAGLRYDFALGARRSARRNGRGETASVIGPKTAP